MRKRRKSILINTGIDQSSINILTAGWLVAIEYHVIIMFTKNSLKGGVVKVKSSVSNAIE